MLQIIIIALLIAGLTAAVPHLQRRQDRRSIRWLLYAAAAVYLLGNAYFTILSREVGTAQHLDLTPFKTYACLFDRQPETGQPLDAFAAIFLADLLPVEGILLNIMLYYPMGYLLSVLFPGLKGWQIILIGCLCSIATEATQYFLQMGWCETDDVIHNTLGTAIGVWVWQLQRKRLAGKAQK